MDKDFMNRMEAKLDRIVEVQSNQAVTLERCVISVEHHVKRSDALEARVEQVAKDIEPIKTEAKFIKWSVRAVLALIAVLEALQHLLHF